MHLSQKASLPCLFFSLLTTVGCTTKPESDTVDGILEPIDIHVQGTVTSYTDGSPIDSARVVMHDELTPGPAIGREYYMVESTFTDSTGFYSMQGTCPKLSEWYYPNVYAKKEGYAAAGRSGELREGVQILDIQIHPLTPYSKSP